MGRKKKSDAEKLAELLGIEAPKGNQYESPEDISREAEATLQYAESPQSFVRKDCKSCGRAFAHTRGAIAYCSNHCRARGLEQIGIRWDWLRPVEDRWSLYEGGEPLVVPPEALELLDALELEPEPDPEPDKSMPGLNSTLDVLDILTELGLD